MIQCRFEDGGDAKLRHVTTTGIVVYKSKILMAKRSPSLTNGGLWCLPGGYLGRDESTSDAIIREVYEETGCKTKIVSLFRINDSPLRPKEDKQNVDFSFLLEFQEEDGSKDWESSEVKWFELNAVPDEKEWAFDHYEVFLLYKKWVKERFPLPVMR